MSSLFDGNQLVGHIFVTQSYRYYIFDMNVDGQMVAFYYWTRVYSVRLTYIMNLYSVKIEWIEILFGLLRKVQNNICSISIYLYTYWRRKNNKNFALNVANGPKWHIFFSDLFCSKRKTVHRAFFFFFLNWVFMYLCDFIIFILTND